MSDNLQDTPYMGRPYCPTCEPDADPSVQILETRYCGTHSGDIVGSADDAVVRESYMSGSMEAGGDDNRTWCSFFHAGKNGR